MKISTILTAAVFAATMASAAQAGGNYGYSGEGYGQESSSWSAQDDEAFSAMARRRVAAAFGNENLAGVHDWKGIQQHELPVPAGCRQIAKRMPGGTAYRVCCGPVCRAGD
jgi:hypothetical protein